jgi:hypothetical protein
MGFYTVIVSEKLPKIPLFGPSLFPSYGFLDLNNICKYGVLLTSFSTQGTKNSLVEINLKSTGMIKGCDFWGVKNWQTLAVLWAGALLCNKRKSQEQNTAG